MAKIKISLKPSEHQEQVAVVQWFDVQYPILTGRLFAIPNGARTTIGTAVKLKREGLRKGCPDLMLPYPSLQYYGLFIEMKVKGGTVSSEQKDWHSFLIKQGYQCHVCYGVDEAITAIINYLM